MKNIGVVAFLVLWKYGLKKMSNFLQTSERQLVWELINGHWCIIPEECSGHK